MKLSKLMDKPESKKLPGAEDWNSSICFGSIFSWISCCSCYLIQRHENLGEQLRPRGNEWRLSISWCIVSGEEPSKFVFPLDVLSVCQTRSARQVVDKFSRSTVYGAIIVFKDIVFVKFSCHGVQYHIDVKRLF